MEAIAASSSSRLCRRSFPKKRFAIALEVVAQREVLPDDRDPARSSRARVRPVRLQLDPAPVGLRRPREALYERGLARSVLADESEDLAGPQIEVDPTQHPQRPEPLPRAPDAQHHARRRISARFLTGILEMRHTRESCTDGACATARRRRSVRGVRFVAGAKALLVLGGAAALAVCNPLLTDPVSQGGELETTSARYVGPPAAWLEVAVSGVGDDAVYAARRRACR